VQISRYFCEARPSSLRAIAHVTEVEPRQPQLLIDHLHGVERLAKKFASRFDAAEWAQLAGRWHDLGKFSDEFQHYIRKESGFEVELVATAPGRVDHSSAGALLAMERFGQLGLLLAYALAGHHAGLPDWSAADGIGGVLENRLRAGREDGLLALALAHAPQEILSAAMPFLPQHCGGAAGIHLWIRMLFSCLVDADFLDTETFLNPEKNRLRVDGPEIDLLRQKLNAFMEEKQRTAPPTKLNQIRAHVLRQCRARAAGEPGIYTLTVPTGGGKTLSSLAFALEHAHQKNKRRVIYAIPYTSIIEQTADVFRKVFKELPGAVLEHHSNVKAEAKKEKDKKTEATTEKSTLAAENWDAPLIVTTNVQLFESLFAARTSRCRKLHNIANSILILDEAQLLPPDFLQPILDVLRLLVEQYGVTVVLCTATQPALGTQLGGHGRTLLKGLNNATEIMDGTDQLYRDLERVTVYVPRNFDERESWDAIADRLQQHESVLAIVNTRADCRELHARMPEGTMHLSALMCGEHRSVLIDEIKNRLAKPEPVRVVSTQLIEAGVDVDFPVVYRALAGLDSIAQAAGRCNREGTQGRGQVFVFAPPKPAPPGLLRFGEQACQLLLEDHPDDPLTPAQFALYFRQYYAKAGANGGLDSKGILTLLADKNDAAQCKIQFRTAAEKFQMIDETASILVPYRNPKDESRDSRIYIKRLRSGEMHRDLLRQLQRFTVSVSPYQFEKLQNANELEEIIQGIWALRSETAYSNELGLLIGSTGSPDPAKLYC
jgi:CRISPR-associated endonuclease/helicase Cas3